MKKGLSFRAQRGTSRITPGVACQVLRCAQDDPRVGSRYLVAELLPLATFLSPGTGERIKVRGRSLELTRVYSSTLTLPSPLRRERRPNAQPGAVTLFA
jgi:hypothetical protein